MQDLHHEHLALPSIHYKIRIALDFVYILALTLDLELSLTVKQSTELMSFSLIFASDLAKV